MLNQKQEVVRAVLFIGRGGICSMMERDMEMRRIC